MRRELLGLILVATLAACSGGGGNSGPPPIPPRRAPILLQYGLVNGWQSVAPEPMLDRIAEKGLTGTAIEWAPWRTGGGGCGCKLAGGCSAETFEPQARHLITEATRRGLWTTVIVHNHNNCTARKQGDGWFKAQLEAIKAIGGKVILVAVSEPWVADAAKAKRWTEIARHQVGWAGPFVVPDKGKNSWSGSPFYSMPHDYLDVHWCDFNRALTDLRKGGSKLFGNTDCSGILNPGAEKAKLLAQAAIDGGSHFLLYDFYGSQPDFAVIDAMGSVVP